MSKANSAVARLADEDSQASQVRCFLQSIEPLAGNNVTPENQIGRDLIQDYALTLASHGDNAVHPLGIPDVALVLDYLSSIQPRPGKEDYAAGGNANCGHLIIMSWLSGSLRASETQVMSRAKVVAIDQTASILNVAQQNGIAGVEEQLEKTYALITGAVECVKRLERSESIEFDDLATSMLLLDMAQNECGDRDCLNRIRDGKYRD